MTSQRLNIAKGEWALKQSKAAQQVQKASADAAAKSSTGQLGSTGGLTVGKSGVSSGGTVPYKSTVTFTIKILDGYDASKMQVGVNGVLLAPKDKSTDGKTYTFEFIAKQETEAISVTGIERKTVTIIYNDNGVPMVPSGIARSKLSVMVAPITAKVSASSSAPPASMEGE